LGEVRASPFFCHAIRIAEIDQAQVSRWHSGATEPLYGSVRRLEASVDALIAARLKKISGSLDAAAKA